MTRRWVIDMKTATLLMLVLGLVLLVACGTSATEAPEPEATAPAAAATSAPAATPTTQAAPTATPIPAAPPAPTSTPVPAAPSAAAAPEGTFNLGVKENLGIFTAHPRLTPGSQGLFVGVTLGETLVAVDHEFRFIPKLVKEWSISDDSLVWTFKLQEGVPFHKGYGEFTAADAVWTVEQCAHPESQCGRANQMRRLWFNDAGSVTIVDDYTIEVNTGEVQYDMLVNISAPWNQFVVSKRAADELGDTEADRLGVGTGPFEFVEYSAGQYWKFQAVEDHWRKTPYFAEFNYVEIPEESTRVANFQVGKLDSMVMNLDSLPVVKEVEGVKFMQVEGGSAQHLGWLGNWYVGVGTEDQREGYDPNLPWVSSNPDTSSEEWERARKVRLAMAISIDRQTIVDTILSGEGQPLVLWGWEGNEHRLDEVTRAGWEYNPEKARQLLVEAGYPDGFEIDVVPSIRDVPGEVDSCFAAATMWEDIGIRPKLKRLDYNSFVPSVRNRIYNGAHCHGSGGFFDPLALHTIINHSTGGFTAGFDHPELDAMMDEAIRTVDEDKRFEIMAKYARWMFDNVAEVGLYKVDKIWPLSSKLDPWPEHLEKGDRRILSGLEYAPHRK